MEKEDCLKQHSLPQLHKSLKCQFLILKALCYTVLTCFHLIKLPQKRYLKAGYHVIFVVMLENMFKIRIISTQIYRKGPSIHIHILTLYVRQYGKCFLFLKKNSIFCQAPLKT